MTISFLHVLSRGWRKSILIVLLFLLAAGQTGMGRTEALASPPTIELTFHDGLISAQLVDAPLIDVLEQIKQEFGFTTHYHGDLTELITMSFTDFPLSKCLRILTANQSLSVATRPSAEPSEQNDTKQIAEIWVLSRNANAKRGNVSPAASLVPKPNETDAMMSVSEDLQEMTDNTEQKDVPLDQELNNQDAEKSDKRQTINNLAALGDSASVMAMAEFTRDADREVRQLSVNGLSSVQSEESTQILGQVLQDEPDPEIRKIALRALSQRQNDMAAQAFLEGALNDADAEVKTLADQLLAQ